MTDARDKPNRRWLQFGMTVLPAILALVPLLVLMISGTATWTVEPSGSISLEAIEHGWPLTFLKRVVDKPQASRWAIWQGNQEWNWEEGAADLALLTSAALLITFVTIRRAKKNRIWHLSLRECLTLMFLIALVATHFGWCIRRGERARALGTKLEALGTGIEYEYCGPKWLRRVEGGGRDSLLDRLSLSSIRSVYFSDLPSNERESAFRLLAEVDRPHEVVLELPKLNMPTLRLFLESVPKCQPESVVFYGLTLEELGYEPWPAGLLEPLGRNPRLKELNFMATGIGDPAIPALLECRHLRKIELGGAEVTPKGLLELLKLPNLQEIGIHDSSLNDEVRAKAAAAGVRLEIDTRGY
jgi:hypothetical protein